MIELFVWIVLCHLIGDYVLQSDYLAMNKGKDWYVLFVHCALYYVPFLLKFGFDWRLLFIFVVHIITDALKARWNKIDIATDQYIHIFIALSLYSLQIL